MSIKIETNPKESHYQLPVMRLMDNIIPWIKKASPLAFAEIEKLVEQKILQDTIIINLDNEQLQSEENPRSISFINSTGQIYLNERSLSFLWLISYALVVNWQELIHKPLLDGTYGKKIFELKPNIIPIIQLGLNHYKLAIKFNNNTDSWDENIFCSPKGCPMDIDSVYCESTNAVFLSAVTFMIMHEVCHARNNDFKKQYYFDTKRMDLFREMENSADEFSLKICNMKEPQTDIDVTKAVGAIAAVSSDLCLNELIYRYKHEDADKRILNIIKSITDDSKSEFFSVGCIALMFWDNQYGIDLDWSDEPDMAYSDLLNRIVDDF